MSYIELTNGQTDRHCRDINSVPFKFLKGKQKKKTTKTNRKIIMLKNPLGLIIIIIISLTNKVSTKEKIRTKVGKFIYLKYKQYRVDTSSTY